MIKNFGNRTAEEIWKNSSSKATPKELWLRAKALLTIMHSTSRINDLKIKGQPPNVRLHKLKGDRKDEWSVTIKLPYCITFKFKNGEFSDVKIENYHKG
jgi:proteic killer suppression protein